jgi:hypothetical protein
VSLEAPFDTPDTETQVGHTQANLLTIVPSVCAPAEAARAQNISVTDAIAVCGNNLHSAWDACLVLAAVGTNVDDAAAKLLTSISLEQIRAWTQSGPKQLASESFKITGSVQTKDCVKHGDRCDPPSGSASIDQAYIDANVPIVKEQLKKAGIRLAGLLDKALGE